MLILLVEDYPLSVYELFAHCKLFQQVKLYRSLGQKQGQRYLRSAHTIRRDLSQGLASGTSPLVCTRILVAGRSLRLVTNKLV